jgi:hypothetical protein
METNYLIAQSYILSNLRVLNFNNSRTSWISVPCNATAFCHSKPFSPQVALDAEESPTELENHLFEYVFMLGKNGKPSPILP